MYIKREAKQYICDYETVGRNAAGKHTYLLHVYILINSREN